MGFRSLGLGFGHWEWKKCQKWEWDKYFVTMTSRDITYFQGLRESKKCSSTLVVPFFGMFSHGPHLLFSSDRFAVNVYSRACKAKSLQSMAGAMAGAELSCKTRTVVVEVEDGAY